MGPSKQHSDVSRAERKAKKRKLEDAIPDLPGEKDDAVTDLVETEVAGEQKAKKRKRDTGDGTKEGDDAARKQEKRAKKREKLEKSQGSADFTVEEVAPKAPTEDGSRKSKKERKAERKAKEAAEALATGKPEAVVTDGAAAGELPAEGEIASKKNNRNREKQRKNANKTPLSGEEEKSKTPAKFIVFIGNLPFSATKASITSHFASVKPKSVRALTQKDDPTKSKGCAFVEFEGYDHMKTCLKLFHHSIFDDGISPARKINVELTAGGGGNTKDRRNKIQDKNTKLNEERVRRLQEEEKAKWEKRANQPPQPLDENGIHPSRRAIVPKS